jgi:transcriptional regulator with XRE-family HTH domain
MARYKRKSPVKLADKLREVRLQLGLTQQQVADRIGTDASAVSRYERGIREPSLLEIYEFCKLSRVPFESLVDDRKSVSRVRR